jgi:hypothetical protein
MIPWFHMISHDFTWCTFWCTSQANHPEICGALLDLGSLDQRVCEIWKVPSLESLRQALRLTRSGHLQGQTCRGIAWHCVAVRRDTQNPLHLAWLWAKDQKWAMCGSRREIRWNKALLDLRFNCKEFGGFYSDMIEWLSKYGKVSKFGTGDGCFPWMSGCHMSHW